MGIRILRDSKAPEGSTPDLLIEAFDYCRQQLFPRWDRKGPWHIRLDRELDSIGLCWFQKKTIVFRALEPDRAKLMALVCHEIVHAVLGRRSGHGARWKRRMLQAAKDAAERDMLRLAELLQQNVESYAPENSVLVTPAVIKGHIDEITHQFEAQTGEIPTLSAVLAVVAPMYALRPADLRRRCKGYKKAHAEAVRSIKLEKSARAKFDLKT